jgi:predicted ATPase
MVMVMSNGRQEETVYGIRDSNRDIARAYIFCTESPITTAYPNPTTKFTLSTYTVKFTSTDNNNFTNEFITAMLSVANGIR